ncbi:MULTISPECIES: M20/M25/M40 family metallo-hydrolase [unclassified Leucobacter]|uniref:M20/M25/M40 family metallo-hydrolase n=1 Tax=unclassified Leucobacter TaxID=2621730 RepID=UPI001BFD8E3F|nr:MULTISPECIES: M20/M25/M40 family metallo-hydrolase [unclassified Leucobacter]
MPALDLLRLAEAAQDTYERDLAALVGIDSGSLDAAGVNRVADWVADRLTRSGFTIERQITTDGIHGDVIVARRQGTGSRRILLFAHMDTVFEQGDAALRPFSIDERGHGRGPGVTDDKAGVVAGIHAAEHLIALGEENYGELVLAFTPDEEIGSPVGAPALAALAANADAGFSLECARENGDLVIARKGAVDLDIEVHGVAAHSGIEPERGAHAALEAAHLTIFLQQLADPSRKLTVNVGILQSGDRTNIVPNHALLKVEMRAAQREVLDETLAKLRARAAAPVVDRTTISVHELDFCPPLEETSASMALGETAVAIAAELGFTPGLARTGGVSDGNRVSALGVPTLDGLGPVGGGDHSPTEWLELASVPGRVALLAELIDRTARA